MRAAFFTGLGDPAIMRITDLPGRQPGAGEVQIRVTSAGRNRADANYRRGKYPVRSPGQSRSGVDRRGLIGRGVVGTVSGPCRRAPLPAGC